MKKLVKFKGVLGWFRVFSFFMNFHTMASKYFGTFFLYKFEIEKNKK
jgi:hypothetical protein